MTDASNSIEPQAGSAEPARKKVLFVDDEPNFLAGLRRMLRGERARVKLYFAGDADEALELVKRERIDTIVSDVNMPRKTGFDLLTALKGNPETRDIPVIILTGNAENDLKRPGRSPPRPERLLTHPTGCCPCS